MSKQKKIVWFYSILLFSAALLLILISALSQSRLATSESLSQKDEQQAFNQTIQKSVTDLIRENERLRGELKKANEENRQLEEESVTFDEENKKMQFINETTEFLFEAEMYFNVGDYAKSRNTLQNVNADVLPEQGIKLYNWLRDKLRKKGYSVGAE
ncbi:MAG: hypothetical protein GX800_04845 [Clostridiaceae bacterium]|jgi:septal ring factor EnvC (AmiA/AmiB activator)|nr:hypothetical protein [Clostridiaceae bacterium]